MGWCTYRVILVQMLFPEKMGWMAIKDYLEKM
jgi:hypothetical protein